VSETVPLDDLEQETDRPSGPAGKTLRRLAGLLLTRRRIVLPYVLVIVVVSVVDGLFTLLGRAFVDDAIVGQNPSLLTRLGIAYGGLVIVQVLAFWALIRIAGALGEGIAYTLRQQMFAHLQRLSLDFYDRTAVGRIVSRVTSDTERVSDLMSWGLLDIGWSLVNITAALVFMLLIDWRLGLIVVAVVPPLAYGAIRFRGVIVGQYRHVRALHARITGAFNEAVTGVRVIKGLAREGTNAVEFASLTSSLRERAYRAAYLSALFLPAVQLIMALALGVVVLVSGLGVNSGRLSIGSVQAFFGYVTFMLWPIQEMARVFAEMQQSLASAERIFALLDAPVSVADRAGNLDQEPAVGPLRFEHVTFAYAGTAATAAPVLEDFSLEVQPGETVALVGPTGGGKTTIVSLIARFYEPSAGRVTSDGRDYRDYTQRAWRARLGMVLQSPHLFSGTIRDNIRYGRLTATDAEVQAAARHTGADEFIVGLPAGYDAEVGEGGTLLSVGQKQLISLARAVLVEPDIFILDEATSSIDSLSERHIQRSIQDLMRGRMSFVIAHRLSTVRQASRILVIERGRIVESGTHAELLRAGDRYRHLYASAEASNTDGARSADATSAGDSA
jgi:ATP-binding cassette subfamily B protein